MRTYFHPTKAYAHRASVSGIVLLLLTLLTACGGAAGNTASGGGNASTPACNKNTGFTLYSAQGYDSDAAKAFKQQTGIAVNLVDDSTGNLLAKISAEGSNPQWDVVWFDGNVTMQTQNPPAPQTPKDQQSEEELRGLP